MKTLLSFGHLSINVFGLFIGLGLLLGYFVALKEAKRKKFDEETIISVILYAMIFGIIGARVFYIMGFNLSYYVEHPLKVFAFRDGGLSIQGGLLGGAIAVLIYTKLKKINVWKAADIMAPGIILGQAIGRIGCDVFGVPMTKNYFWGITMNGQILHPAQIYESALNFVLFGFIWSRRKSTQYDGQLFFTYLIGFSLNRFIVEFFRTNPIVIQPFTVAHMTSIVLIIIAVIMMKILGKNSSKMGARGSESFDISFREILWIVLAILGSVFIYYGWIW